MDLHNQRSEYALGQLSRSDLDKNPTRQFEQWLSVVVDSDFRDPTAMVLATVDEQGCPNQRYVLLKKVDDKGFVFFTDTSSAKGKELAQNPKASLLFPWHFMERQVRVRGEVESLPRSQVLNYFKSRPIESQQAAACSQQSEPISSREALQTAFSAMQDLDDVVLPDRWGGYLLKPQSFEFWQGGKNRLHDRFQYFRLKNDQWSIERLQP